MRLLLEQYDVKIDTRYRMIHIANGAFNAFAQAKPTEESVAFFMQLYNEEYRKTYDSRNNYTAQRVKDFYFYKLRRKDRRYKVKKRY